MSPRRTLGGVVPVGRHRVDEGLIVQVLFTGSNERRLAVRFAGELWGVHVRNPDLDRPQALLPQPFAMSSDAVAGRWHNTMLHVTAWDSAGDVFHSHSPVALLSLRAQFYRAKIGPNFQTRCSDGSNSTRAQASDQPKQSAADGKTASHAEGHRFDPNRDHNKSLQVRAASSLDLPQSVSAARS